MRIDLPLCDFKFCKFESDSNCTSTSGKRERCEYLRLKTKEDDETCGYCGMHVDDCACY